LLGISSRGIELNLASNVIALIEDDPLLRVPIAKALEDAGYKVASAASGSEGLAMLQDPRFDLAVIDIFLPGHLDGVLLRRRRESRTRTCGFFSPAGSQLRKAGSLRPRSVPAEALSRGELRRLLDASLAATQRVK